MFQTSPYFAEGYVSNPYFTKMAFPSSDATKFMNFSAISLFSEKVRVPIGTMSTFPYSFGISIFSIASWL